MRIAIIGPSHIPRFLSLMRFRKETYLARINETATQVAKAGHDIVIVPHKKSVSEAFAATYSLYDGKKVVGIMPLEDLKWGFDFLNQEICDRIINCKTWYNVSKTLVENSDALLCLGFTPGSIIEICETKWYRRKKAIIVEDFVSQRLPKEVTEKLNVRYVRHDSIEF